MTILLTSLGTGNYHPSSYQIEDSISDQQAFFSVALAKHLSPDRVISLQTSQAADLHGTALANDLKRLNIDHEVVSIPEGKSENELWQIFSVLTSHIPQACTLHLDITHGFRSLPLLGFIALNYLRVTRNITIGSLRYGAWEAKNNNDIAPSFDLSPFLTLLDWSAAADQFKATGAADRIARLLKETQISLWKNRGNEGPEALPKLLSTLGTTIDHAANNLTLLRTGHLKESAKSVDKQLERIQETPELENHARPFLELLEPVREDLTRFAGNDLSDLRDLIAWLVEKNRPDSALTLASEWLISWVIVTLGHPLYHTEDQRKPFSDCLNLCIDRVSKTNRIQSPSEESKTLLTKLEESVKGETLKHLVGISSKVKDTRNDLNHAGFRKDPRKADAIIKLASEIAGELRKLPLPAAPLSSSPLQ